ncbi:c-type cytochrome [uncultured Maritimibacter sp.]|jgi:mono/diheme cytochrome c family protein|uniref:c-type cytochrome n=1 Tax=uncultured Maritimibacter sp. TaxID=991866 RepID=UPI000A7C3118|nr:c-type cytochrome [uncultured Maritimibacter sp.]
MRVLLTLVIVAALAIGAGLFITRPKADGADVLAGLTPDPAHGEIVFTASGCASCHMAEGATGEAKLVLSGGQAFPSDFGTFHAPNISQSESAGIGGWTDLDLWNALHHGTSPEGEHYYPVLPYGAYIHMTPQDVVDLHAYMVTLPADETPSLPHDVGFPFSIRASLGGWKMLFLNDDWVMQGDLTSELERGRELVEAMGHCAECHTPRNALGGLKTGADWLSGAPNPAGRGSFPDLVTLDWSADEIAEYLSSGFTPEFDSAGGHMALVVENFAALAPEDRAAVAAYIKALPIQ